jgi:ParB family chromosome partitioning protein
MANKKKKALGTSLDILMPTGPEETLDQKLATEVEATKESDLAPVAEPTGKPLNVKISEISKNPDQPRKNFTGDELTKLVNSIKEKGILEPLVVFKTENGYQLIAGHRRLMAAEMADLESVPVIVRDRVGGPTENLELALIENIIRQDLNPIEEAEALERLENHYKKDVYSIAKLVGKESATVKNSIRLLKLPSAVKQDIREGRLSAGHGKIILSLEDQPEEQMKLRTEILSKALTVRQAEALAKRLNEKTKRKSKARETEEKDAFYDALAKNISESIHDLKVNIVYWGRKKQVIINYNTMGDLEYFLKKLDITIQS